MQGNDQKRLFYKKDFRSWANNYLKVSQTISMTLKRKINVESFPEVGARVNQR